MAQGFDPLGGIDTRAYRGRQRPLQDMEQVIREMADRQGRKERSFARLVLAIMALSLLLGLSVVGNIVQGMHGVRVEPWVEQLDHLGNQQPLVRLKNMPATPAQTQVVGTLTTWTQFVRIISSDATAMAMFWDIVKDYTSNAGLGQLEAYRAQQKERQQQGKRVWVAKVSVQPLQGSRSYHVEWEECTANSGGQLVLLESASWKATLAVADFQSQAVIKARELRLSQRNYRNLLGILVDDIQWKPEPYASYQQALSRCGGQ
jgi:type IV secretory pathway TrbF-like protein